MDNKTAVNNPASAVAAPVQPVQTAEPEMETINLVELFYVFLDHMWQVAAAVIAGALLAFVVTQFFITPMYEATAQIYVVSASNNSMVNLADLQIGSQLTNDYQKLLMIHPLIEEVNANLNLNMSYRQLTGMVTISNPANTRLLNITVKSPSPENAAEIANEIARLSTEYLPEIMESAAPHLADAALVPTRKSSPSLTRNVMLGALGFAVLYCGWLAVAFIMDDTFKSAEDVKKYLGEAPIGVIPEGDLGTFNRKKTGGKSGHKKD